jgi:hypothetical protein
MAIRGVRERVQIRFSVITQLHFLDEAEPLQGITSKHHLNNKNDSEPIAVPTSCSVSSSENFCKNS